MFPMHMGMNRGTYAGLALIVNVPHAHGDEPQYQISLTKPF